MLMHAAMACKYKSTVQAMEYFIKHGMDVNACNKQKETALMKVIDQPYVFYGITWESTAEQNKCHSERVKLLVESGADVNKKNAAGDTALILAAKQNQLEYIKILLSAGAHINRFNKAGHNAYMFHVAESKRKNEDLKMLLFAAGESKKQFKSKKSSKSTLSSFFKFLHKKGKKSSDGATKSDVYNIDWSCWTDEKDSSEEVTSLKESCREVIRRCLLELDPYRCLFQRTPLLGLPQALNSYLLYDTDLSLKELDEVKESEEETGESEGTDDVKATEKSKESEQVKDMEKNKEPEESQECEERKETEESTGTG